MNVACAFTELDKEVFLSHMHLLHEMGQQPKHTLFLMPAKGISFEDTLRQFPVSPWKSIVHVPDAEGVKSDWSKGTTVIADGPNSMFRQLAWHFIFHNLGAFLFLEPDATLLVPDAIDRFEIEYATALSKKKVFLGVTVPQQGIVDAHMTGVGIYPANLPNYTSLPLLARKIAFDVAGGKEVLPKMYPTRLIQHVRKINGENPTFPDRESLNRIHPEAVLFHSCKDLSLHQRLREKMGFAKGVASTIGVPQSLPNPPEYERIQKLEAELAEMKALLSQKSPAPAPTVALPVVKRKRGVSGLKRTKEQQQVINDRMAKARAARSVKKVENY